MTNELTNLLQLLDAKQHVYDQIDRYYNGTPPLSFLAPEAREALAGRFGVLGSNLCRLAVTAISERLRVTGFRVDGAHSDQLWGAWVRNDLDQLAGVAHREALALGQSFAIVWADTAGKATVSIEDARHVAVVRDPATRHVTAAVKRWTTDTTTEAVVYGRDRITRYTANTTSAVTGFTVTSTVPNPTGWVPVVELRNTDRLTTPATSELRDLMPLQDALNKLLADLMVGSEYFARPRRWVTGVELEEDEDGIVHNPFPEGHRMMVAEEEGARFGQLPASDLGSYESAITAIVQQMQAISGLPDHMVGITSNQPPSADSLRASEASLTARAEQKQAAFGRAWETVARLILAVENGTAPEDYTVRITWSDPATRSVAQEADATVKLVQAGILPASWALRRLGYTTDEIDEIQAARRTEHVDQAAAGLAGKLVAS
ncbi:phage portal protein [Helcobacillus sp. ACRRO]|uniref:phage portal protein n=1 Tax=Helcobacillus sp. ACRRO TaxID=2918202 RepID=UPI001EF5F407|nr:phage portal protein [Helcobacillus sp. ACRRO]MCG7426031.1 phage portal protein [Helcobacillus sp. ACRRO]